MPTDLLYYHDAYLRSFGSSVVAVDAVANAVALAKTAFFPTGGGQPNDLGTLTFDGVVAEVVNGQRERRPRLARPRRRRNATCRRGDRSRRDRLGTALPADAHPQRTARVERCDLERVRRRT